ncbi:MAG TPA: methyltransferase [Holophaga sp.]|nr:methyltransferase [Holophaga sp.]
MSRTRTLPELVQSIRSFQESRTLLTALELDVFSAVENGATAEEAARSCGADPGAMARLLDALVALGALLKRGGVYRVTHDSAQLIPAREGLLHTVHLWEAWSTLTACVKAGTAVAGHGPEGLGTERTQAFIAAMHARAWEAAGETLRLLGALGEAGEGQMLDIGGGSGAFSLAFARHFPELKIELLDLGPVTAIARKNVQDAGLEGRIAIRAGDMRTAAFGQGFDLVLLSAVLHMFGEAEARGLIHRAAGALGPGGRLIIREFLLEEDRTAPLASALFSLNMLVATPQGRSYTETELRQWMVEAGLVEIARPDPEGDVMLGTKA